MASLSKSNVTQIVDSKSFTTLVYGVYSSPWSRVKAMRSAVANELHAHGFSEQEMGLHFTFEVSAKLWIGRTRAKSAAQPLNVTLPN
eukprot:2002297-Amphidinium_carterae.1